MLFDHRLFEIDFLLHLNLVFEHEFFSFSFFFVDDGLLFLNLNFIKAVFKIGNLLFFSFQLLDKILLTLLDLS